MHSGYCSAPRTIFPPWTGAADGVPPPPPGVVLLLHAAATRPATETAATVRMSQRNRIPFPPFGSRRAPRAPCIVVLHREGARGTALPSHYAGIRQDVPRGIEAARSVREQ